MQIRLIETSNNRTSNGSGPIKVHMRKFVRQLLNVVGFKSLAVFLNNHHMGWCDSTLVHGLRNQKEIFESESCYSMIQDCSWRRVFKRRSSWHHDTSRDALLDNNVCESRTVFGGQQFQKFFSEAWWGRRSAWWVFVNVFESVQKLVAFMSGHSIHLTIRDTIPEHDDGGRPIVISFVVSGICWMN